MRSMILAAAVVALACPPVMAQQQAVRSGQTAASPAVDAFARAAAENNLTEVLLASVALQKTGDKRVQDDAWTMLDHHSRALGDLAEALSEGSAALSSEPSGEQKAALQRMRGLTGTQFDQAYFTYQAEAHRRSVALFERAGQLPDQKVANYARVTLPVLRAHAEISQIRQAQPPQPMPGQ